MKEKTETKIEWRKVPGALLHLFFFLFYGLSCLVPRNKDKWLVGKAKGFNDNAKYFFIHAHLVLGKKDCYWISKTKKTRKLVRDFGFKAYHPWSPIGIYHQLTAGVFVFDMRISAFNYWISGGAKRVNLWHGIAMKNVEFGRKIHGYSQTWLDKLYRPAHYMKPHLFLSTALAMSNQFSRSFRIPVSRCVESDYPRCALFNWSREELLAYVNKYESKETQVYAERFMQASRTYIYMPTFRERGQDFLKEAGFDLERLERVLAAKNELFVFKLHPFTRIKLDTSQFKHILFMDSRTDIYPLLPLSNVMITDYSSIYYDYMLMPDKEILLFPFDYEEYIKYERDLAWDFDQYMPAHKVYTFDALLEVIESGRKLPYENKEWIKEHFWGKEENHTDLYEAIDKL